MSDLQIFKNKSGGRCAVEFPEDRWFAWRPVFSEKSREILWLKQIRRQSVVFISAEGTSWKWVRYAAI